MNYYSEAVDINNTDNFQVLAIQYVPMQDADFANTFPISDALLKGTVFSELYLPFCAERGAR